MLFESEYHFDHILYKGKQIAYESKFFNNVYMKKRPFRTTDKLLSVKNMIIINRKISIHSYESYTNLIEKIMLGKHGHRQCHWNVYC